MDVTDTKIDLHARLHGTLQEQLAQPLHTLFDELDTRLFDLAERSRSGTQQHMYFDALRQLRMARVEVETQFLQSADEALKPVPENPHQRSARGPLELLDKGEQEETLQLEQQIQQLSERLAPALTALLARLAELAATTSPNDPLLSPLAPRGLSRAFRSAMDRADVNIEIRLIAFGLFGQHVLRSLDPLYRQLNTLLRDAGILPDIVDSASQRPTKKYAPVPRRAGPRRTPEDDAPVAASTQATERISGEPDGNDIRLGELHELLSARNQALHAQKQSQQPADVDPQTTFVYLHSSTLDSALDALWTYEGEPLEFKLKLLDKARALASEGDARLTSDDEDIVDLIGLLFTRIQQDSDLPKPMRDLLTRLHIPFLRTALKESDLLHGSNHPARELLDELGELAVGWCPSSDPTGNLLKVVALTVEQLASHHLNDKPIEYGHAIDALNQQLEALRRRAEVAEQRTIETTIGRERLALARNRVSSLLQQRLHQYEPMPWVRQLLRGPWAHHLALVWLRNSESSSDFRQALRFVDDLLWADESNGDSQDLDRLAQVCQDLPAQLRQGLSGVTLHDSEIEELARRLENFLDAQLQGEQPADFLYENDPSLAQADYALQWQDSITINQPVADEVDPALLAKLRSLAPGTWFEFQASPHEDMERAKLCWTSPYTGHNLFVSRTGSKSRELSAEELVVEVESGLARVIESNRLLERSLRALIDQLRKSIDNLDETQVS